MRLPSNEDLARCYIIIDMSEAAPSRKPIAAQLHRRVRLRQLALVGALDERRNLRSAASALGLTQPAATKLLRDLESVLGVLLFERLPRGMRPTSAGEAVARRARTVLTELDRIQEELGALSAGATGVVAAGAVRGAVAGLLTPALAAIRRERPMVRFHILVDAAEILIPQLREGRLDLVLGSLPVGVDAGDLAFEPLIQQPLAVVARRGHPLTRETRLNWRLLRGAEWIVYPQESPVRPVLESLLADAGARAAARSSLIETASILATTMLLERTDVLAVVPRDVAEHHAERGLLAILPIQLPIKLGRIGIVTRPDRTLSPATTAFMQEVRRLAARRGVNRGSGRAG